MQYGKQTKKNYLLWNDSEKPQSIPKGLTNKTLDKLDKIFRELSSVLLSAGKIEDFLDNEILPWNMGLVDLECYASCASDQIQDAKEFLATHNDEPNQSPEVFTLELLGYKKGFFTPSDTVKIYEKVIEDSDEREIIDEIVLHDGENVLRRRRTTVWEKTDYGKHSKRITYRKMPIGKKLSEYIENTQKALHIKE